MQTVNFNCPHCGNLMAVGTNLLGRNVRCPHCKQVVRAPAAAGELPAPQAPVLPPAPPPSAPPQPPLPSFTVPERTEHHESIFGEAHDEDLFGTEPARPTIPPPPPPPPPPPAPSAPPEYMGETVTVAAQPMAPSYPDSSTNLVESSPAAPAFSFEAPSPPEYAPLPEPPAEEPTQPSRAGSEGRTYRPRIPHEETPSTPAFTWILLGYSLLVTVAAGFFAFQYFTTDSAGEHPFKAIPDVLREYDPAKKPQVSFIGMPDPKLKVPPELRVKLGSELTIGDLWVQPTTVEVRRVEAVTESATGGDDRQRGIGQTLVMTLRVKNLSPDTSFCPNDPAFNRALDPKQPVAPYTALQVHQKFFYGPFLWPFVPGTREYLADYSLDDKPLGPGEEKDVYVAIAPTGIRTSGSTNIIRTYQELDNTVPLLWRVQLRRGLVSVKTEDRTAEVSATAVIGVEFRKDQVRQ